MKEKVGIMGVQIDNIDFNEARKKIENYLKSDKLNVIYTPNPEIVMRAKEDESLVNMLNRADLVTADGIGLIYAAKINKVPLKERVTGFDMSMEMLKIANRDGLGIYLLGGAEGISKKASENIKKDYPNIKVLGNHSGFFKGSHTGNKDDKEELSILEEINRVKPDIIFVGMGFPRQEIWIDENRSRITGKVIIGNGGVMDILAGKVNRAPKVFQKLGLEWLYRLITNPSRIKRQIILPKFMLESIFKGIK